MSTTANHKCMYVGCFNDNRRNKDIAFFKFPVSDINRAEEWQKNCGNFQIAIMDAQHLNNKLVCEKHFLPSDINMSNKRKLLRRHAVPIRYLSEETETVDEETEPVNLRTYQKKRKRSSSITENDPETNGNSAAHEAEGKPSNIAKIKEAIEVLLTSRDLGPVKEVQKPKRVYGRKSETLEIDLRCDEELLNSDYSQTSSLAIINDEIKLNSSLFGTTECSEIHATTIIKDQQGEKFEITVEDRCRTCLKSFSSNSSLVFTDFQKEMLSRCVPQIEIIDTDSICGECSNNLRISYEFITQCHNVENVLKQATKDDKIDDEITCTSIIEQNEPPSSQNDELPIVPIANKPQTTDSNNVKEGEKTDINYEQYDEHNNSERIVDPEVIAYKLKQVTAGFPTINIVTPSTDKDLDCNFEITANPKFKMHMHLSRVLSLPYKKDLLPKTHFDLSTSQTANKRILLLGKETTSISCKDCYKELAHSALLRGHKEECWKFIWKCDICSKRFYDKKLFKVHKQHHNRHHCVKCKEQFTSKGKLTKHRYECGIDCCGETFRGKGTYTRHLHKQHRKSAKHEDFLCDTCGKSFKSATNLKYHKYSHSKPVTCHICKKVVRNRLAYLAHIEYAHRQRKNFMCEHCGKVLSNRIGLKTHQERHVENRIKKYNCVLCNRQFYTRTGLSMHNKLKHTYQGNLNYTCDKCGEKFSRHDYLKRHQAQHMPIEIGPKQRRRYKYLPTFEIVHCSVCNKEFQSQLKLDSHMKSHDYRNRKYQCNLCELRFTFKHNLSRHQKIHNSGTFRCRICFAKTFDNQEDLEDHEETHPKKYHCNQCDKKFGRKYLLGTHMSTEHMDSGNCEENPELTPSEQNFELQSLEM